MIISQPKHWLTIITLQPFCAAGGGMGISVKKKFFRQQILCLWYKSVGIGKAWWFLCITRQLVIITRMQKNLQRGQLMQIWDFAIANLLLYYIIKIILWMQVVEAEETVSFFRARF